MKDSYILIRVPPALKKKAQLLAKMKYSNLSEFIRQLIVDALQEKKRSREE